MHISQRTQNVSWHGVLKYSKITSKTKNGLEPGTPWYFNHGAKVRRRFSPVKSTRDCQGWGRPRSLKPMAPSRRKTKRTPGKSRAFLCRKIRTDWILELGGTVELVSECFCLVLGSPNQGTEPSLVLAVGWPPGYTGQWHAVANMANPPVDWLWQEVKLLIVGTIIHYGNRCEHLYTVLVNEFVQGVSEDFEHCSDGYGLNHVGIIDKSS